MTQSEPTHMNLLLALFLSSKQTAHRQIVLPEFGYELVVRRDEAGSCTMTVALWEDREDEVPAAPHLTQVCQSVDDLLVYLDEQGVPHEGWYPFEEV